MTSIVRFSSKYPKKTQSRIDQDLYYYCLNMFAFSPYIDIPFEKRPLSDVIYVVIVRSLIKLCANEYTCFDKWYIRTLNGLFGYHNIGYLMIVRFNQSNLCCTNLSRSFGVWYGFLSICFLHFVTECDFAGW